MGGYIKHRVMLGDRSIKLALLTLLVLFAVSTAVWAGNGGPPGCCQVVGECANVAQEAFCDGGIFTAGEVCSCGEGLCEGECIEPPSTRDINVRVIAICAAPVGVEPHEGGDGDVCLCFGPRSNGFNATATQRNGRCARSQTGPFCFVDTLVGPLFWKETVRRQSGPTTVGPGDIVEAFAPCPPGKMVLSCQGEVLVGDTNEPAANTSSNIFPTPNGLACKHVARTDTSQGPPPPDPCDICPCKYFDVPMSEACWGDSGATRVFDPGVPNSNCDLRLVTGTSDLTRGIVSNILVEPPESNCGIEHKTGCPGDDISENVTAEEATACRTCLVQYATELNQLLSLTQQPPYMCAVPE